MAEFETGNTSGGRPKGSSNKATKELRGMVLKLVEKNFRQLQKDLDSLEPVERINAMTKLLQFVIPKQNKTEVSKSTTSKTLIIQSVGQNTIDITPKPEELKEGDFE